MSANEPVAQKAPSGQVITVPLEQILVVVQDNPRGPYPSQEVEQMAASLKLGGQEVPVLLRPRTPEERAQAYPEKGYKLVGGYLRFAAASLAGLTTLEAYVREMEPRRARRAAILDNVRKDMHWLAWGESAESLLANDPDLTIQGVADLLSRDRGNISKTLKLLKALNKATREAIRVNYTAPDGYDLPESCGQCLGDLATGQPSDQDLLGKAFGVALDRRMDLAQAKKLVDWVKKGNSPEDFGQKEPKETPADPYAAYWPQLGPDIKVKMKGEGVYQVLMTIQGGTKAWGAAYAASQLLKGSPQSAVDGRQLSIPKQPEIPTSANAPIGAPPRDDGKAKVATPNLFLEKLAGMKILTQVQAKLKKGEKLNGLEYLVLVGDWLGRMGLLVWKDLLRPILLSLKIMGIKLLRAVWRVAKNIVNSLFRATGRTVHGVWELVAPAVVVVLGIWLLWLFFVDHVTPVDLLRRAGLWAVHQVSSPFTGHSSQGEPAKKQLGVRSAELGVNGKTEISPQDKIAINNPPTPEVYPDAPPLPSQGQNEGKTSSQAQAHSSQGGTAKQVPPATKPNPKPQGDVLRQAGEVAGKAAGGIDAARKLFGF